MVSWKDNCNVSILYPTSSNATTRTQERKKRTARTTYWRQMGHSASCLAQLVQAAMCPHSSSTHSSGAAMQILQHSSAGSLSTSATRATSLPATNRAPRAVGYSPSQYCAWFLHRVLARSSRSFLSRQPLYSTRLRTSSSFSCFTFSTSRSDGRLNCSKLICLGVPAQNHIVSYILVRT